MSGLLKGGEAVEMQVVRQRIICCHKTFCKKCWGAGSYIRETRVSVQETSKTATKEAGSTDENH